MLIALTFSSYSFLNTMRCLLKPDFYHEGTQQNQVYGFNDMKVFLFANIIISSLNFAATYLNEDL